MNKLKERAAVVLLFFCPGELNLGAEQSCLLNGIRPYLRDTKSLALVMQGEAVYWPATRFLTWVSLRSSSRTGDTVRTYAEGLVTYLNYVINEEIDLDLVSERTLQFYRNWLVDINGARKSLSPTTINLRLNVAMMFHSWCEREGVLCSSVRAFRALNTPAPNFTTRSIRTSRPGRSELSLHVRNSQRLPRILSHSELQAVIKMAGEPYGLMIRWAVTTGIRRFEICDLKIKDLPARQIDRGGRLREILLYRKGGSRCKIFVPNALIDETWSHIQFQRSVASSSPFVFLSRNGAPIHRGHLSKVFKESCLGIAAGATFHHLRHTYAVVVLTMLQQRAAEGDSINPLKTLQVMMGHASIETTEIYLRALDIHSEAVEQTLYYLYGGEIDAD